MARRPSKGSHRIENGDAGGKVEEGGGKGRGSAQKGAGAKGGAGKGGRRDSSGKAEGTSVQQFKVDRLNIVIKVGDTVLLRPPSDNVPEYVARVQSIHSGPDDTRIRTRWYYRPEESLGGRRNFHGEKELFLSDHYDECSVDAILGTCHVHTFKNYVKLGTVEPEDFFCRFEYKATTGTFKPDHVAVYCVCEMPYNPDDLMVQCDGCKDWFHPACVSLTPEQIRLLNTYWCATCISHSDAQPQQQQQQQQQQHLQQQQQQQQQGQGPAPPSQHGDGETPSAAAASATAASEAQIRPGTSKLAKRGGKR